MLNWANQFNIFLFLDSCNYKDKYSCEDWILAVDAVDAFTSGKDVLNDLRNWLTVKKDWVFGNLNYDLKNEMEQLHSAHEDEIEFPEIYLFQPAIVIRKNAYGVEISSLIIRPEDVFDRIRHFQILEPSPAQRLDIQPKISKEQYIQIVEKLRKHILQGDCYEINFCQEFFARNAVVAPLNIYQQLVTVSPTPFAGFYKLNNKYLLCASPERFLQKRGSKLISQPIKGTSKRDLNNTAADGHLIEQLQSSQKDRSENVMVVDLVRNDLSKVCKQASVHVEELYGIYQFPQVHQMISTIVGELKEGYDVVDILKAAFPMGSMTGAPKFRVMQLIEEYEKSKRGIYSGSIGYISPEGDFDFNVVIRSIMYNSSKEYLSYQVGGGITFYSEPEKEYEECLLKAQAIKKVLQ
jgi:para-aminobenzoate synthetase component I